MRSPRTPKLHLPSRVAQICRSTSQPWVRDARQRRTSLAVLQPPGRKRRRRKLSSHGGFDKPETNSAMISAAVCGCLARATLCPAPMRALRYGRWHRPAALSPRTGGLVCRRRGAP